MRPHEEGSAEEEKDPRYVFPDGGRVRRLRRLQGWSQEAFAEAAGVSVRTVRNVEGSRRSTATTVGLVARALGVAPAALVRRRGGEAS